MHQIIAMAPSSGNPQDGMVSTLIMFSLIIAIFYFMIIRPQSKQRKEREKMLSAVKKGDKVVTTSGLHATVAGLDEKTVLLEVSDNIKMKFDRGAITSILREGDPEGKKSK
jgi:preprotein translocase subunit YajC